MFSRSPFSVSSPLKEMAARDPNERSLVQLDLTDPLVANLDPFSPTLFGPPILPTGFPRVNLPGPGPQCFTDLGHYQTHACLKINDRVRANPLISSVPTIIIGLGASHAPSNPDGPSIAVVVHSRTWPEISEYRAYSCTKPPKVEMIDSLYKPVPGDDGETKDVGIMREVLQDFEESSGITNPERIIIFRYGVNVSESHLTQILEAELDQISKVCKFYHHEWSPKFTAICLFENEASENPRNTYDDSKIGGSVTSIKIVENQIGFSTDEVERLVDSLSYVNKMRTQAISQSYKSFYFCSCVRLICAVAHVCGPPECPKLEEPEAKRVKGRKELDEDELKSERKYITDDDELALYVLGRLNAEKGGKYTLEKFLHLGWGTFWKKSFSDRKMWSHVIMYAQESNGENVCRKIIFGELGYSDGKYEPVNVTVLDPNKPEEIKYGCGFCSRGYAGELKNPHPADPSAYTMGHWTYAFGSWDPSGLIPETPYPY